MLKYISKQIALHRAKKFLKAWRTKNILDMLMLTTKVYQSKKQYDHLEFLTTMIKVISYNVINVNRVSNVMQHVNLDIMYDSAGELRTERITLKMIGMSKPYVTNRFIGYGIEINYLIKELNI